MRSLPQNYFLVTHHQHWRVYELESEQTYRTNSLVLIPYSNPQVKKPVAQFYPVKKIHELSELPSGASSPLFLKARTSKEEYLKKVNALKHHIQQGNIYEINYCMEFFAEDAVIDPLAVFVKLQQLTKAPYSALLKLDNDYIICGSPELFLKKEGGTISSKPIKGTIRRGSTATEDEELKNQLHNSLKERTENVMAVDVARNDLSRFAQKGTVKVNKLYNIETFETVHQMVSTVNCEMKPGITFENMLDAAFPMASMTGAPKIRAMQLIDEFEDFERKNYSGAMGLIDEKGDFTLSVIIRSIFYNQQTKRISIAVGGAITHLSKPEEEYAECLLKARAMLGALNAQMI